MVNLPSVPEYLIEEKKGRKIINSNISNILIGLLYDLSTYFYN